MHLASSLFSNTSNRAGLEKYYEQKKADTVAAWKARETEGNLPSKLQFKDPQTGEIKTVTRTPIDAEKMEKAFVSFDKWLDFQKEFSQNPMMNGNHVQKAQARVAELEKQSPESPSHVHSTFSVNGKLLAYINMDGTLVTSNGGEKYLENVSGFGAAGKSRQVQNILSQIYGTDLNSETYSASNSPSKKEFAQMWYNNFDVTQYYNDTLAQAKEHLKYVQEYHQNWQKNVNEIQQFFLSLQEA